MSSNNSTFVQQNDPAELLEVFDAHGRPTGRARSRRTIHVDGDWHQAFHCWILRQNSSQIVLQRRSLAKDTFGGFWDAAAAGHWRFGETPQEAARELAEELGLEVDFERLRFSGRERLARRFANGLIDREHHQVYVLEWDAPLLTYRPEPAEVSALGAFDTRALIGAASGRVQRLEAVEAVTVNQDGTLEAAQIEILATQLVPYSSARLRRLLKSARHG